MIIVFLCCVIGAMAGEIYVLVKQRAYWKASAMGNARGRHDMYKDLREQERLINKNAAKELAWLKAENQDLRDALQRQKNMYRRLLEQMDRRTQEGGTT